MEKENIKTGNFYGYLHREELGLVLSKVIAFNGNLVEFDNSVTPVNYIDVRRIEVNPLNCESFGWKKAEKVLSTFNIDGDSAVILTEGVPCFVYKSEDNNNSCQFTYLDELQGIYRLIFPGRELPVNRT